MWDSPKEIDQWELEREVEYEDYLNDTCDCESDCECMTFEQFKDNYMKTLDEYFQGMDEQDDEEMYA